MFSYLDIKTLIIIGLILAGKINSTFSQSFSPDIFNKVEKPRQARLLFYNCENLFDYRDDSLKNDEEFLPEGDRHWTRDKYYGKLKRVAQVITAAGGWSPPEIVGLCEIENYKTLHDLTRNTPLYLSEYSIIHNESPDNRGIDVALLYQPSAYTPISTKFIAINFPAQPEKHTREILYSKGMLSQDTLHLFVNHWPSRYGGQLESEEYRIFVASVLKKHLDSIFISHVGAKIVVMGDFNDEPHSSSISRILKAENIIANLGEQKLYNVSQGFNQTGTHKYQGNWALLDQFMISGNLLKQHTGIYIHPEDFTIFNPDFLLEKDETYLGFKPFRTFVGFKYNQGYSDHLPIFIDIQSAKN